MDEVHIRASSRPKGVAVLSGSDKKESVGDYLCRFIQNLTYDCTPLRPESDCSSDGIGLVLREVGDSPNLSIEYHLTQYLKDRGECQQALSVLLSKSSGSYIDEAVGDKPQNIYASVGT